MTTTEAIRIDRWLWSVRLFKSRAAATKACSEGKVRVGGDTAKPAARVRVGDLVEVRRREFTATYTVDRLINKRVGAQVAQECYTDLTPERPKKVDLGLPQPIGAERPRGAGRPTKRERRAIDRLRGR